MRNFAEVIFTKVFGLFRAVCFIFLAYCTTIINTTDFTVCFIVVALSFIIIAIIIFRYIYIRNDKKIKDALNTGLTNVIKDRRNDIIYTTKMIIVDFFTGLISMFILVAFLKKIL